MNPDPLVDLDARLLSISSNTPTPIVIDRLLRLQNGDDWQKPITVYISPAEDNRSIGVLDFLQIYAVTRVLRSPIHTVALGTLRGYDPLILAAGQRGHRHILNHSLICLEPFKFDGLPFCERPIGMAQAPGASLREQAEKLLRAELDAIMQDLRLDRDLFKIPKIVSAEESIAKGLADAIVPIHTPRMVREKQPDLSPKPALTAVP